MRSGAATNATFAASPGVTSNASDVPEWPSASLAVNSGCTELFEERGKPGSTSAKKSVPLIVTGAAAPAAMREGSTLCGFGAEGGEPEQASKPSNHALPLP